jgi:anti-sigma factor RsiW
MLEAIGTEIPPEDLDRLERLISRSLDHELSAEESAELERWLERDPAAERLYEQMAWVDAQVVEALHGDLAHDDLDRDELVHSGLMIAPSQQVPWWRAAGVAVAAGIASLFWMGQPQAVTPDAANSTHNSQASMGLFPNDSIWAAPAIDSAAPVDKEMFGLEHTGLHDVDRKWVIMPSEEPGEYLLIEIRRVRTEAYPLHADF